MAIPVLIVILIFALYGSSKADVVVPDERSASRTSAEAMSTSFVSMTTKGPDFPTPITTALPTSFIPLYVPQVDPNGGPQPLQVDYLGAANGGSTIYQVVMQGHLTEYPVTATLFEDASNAKLLGGQQILTIDGMATAVYAAASCGFQDGLHSATASKAAGICYYWHAIDHSTSTWASAITQISAQTSVKPTGSPDAVELSSSKPNDDDVVVVWTSSASPFPPAPLSSALLLSSLSLTLFSLAQM